MSYMITDADNIFPWNLRTIDQQSSVCNLINLFDTFSNSFNKLQLAARFFMPSGEE